MDYINWLEKHCKEKIVSDKEAVSKIKGGSRVFIGTGCGEPQHLIKTMVNDVLPDNATGIQRVKGMLAGANESKTEDVCIDNKECEMTGESCIDERCDSYHNCPIDSHCNDKNAPPTSPFTPFAVFIASERGVSCGGN
jgi:hypothetical protein